MNRLFLLIFIALIVVSCKKDKDKGADLTPTIPKRILKTIMTPDPSYTMECNYQYEKDNVKRISFGEIVIDVHYSTAGAKIDSLKKHWINANNPSTVVRFSYQGDKLVRVFEETDNVAHDSATTTYYYKGDQLDSIGRKSNSIWYFHVSNLKFNYDSKGNIKEVKCYAAAANRLWQVQQYEYSNEVNPLRKLKSNYLEFHALYFDEVNFVGISMASVLTFYHSPYRMKSGRFKINNDPEYTNSYQYQADNEGKLLKILRNGGAYMEFIYD